MRIAVFLVLLACFAGYAQAVTIAWTPVGDPGNAPDLPFGSGNVAYSYNIGTYDVTNNQYVEFLNAKDPNGTSPLQLYNSNMSNATYGGISYNSGNSPGSKYSVIPGDGNHPVNYVSWYDAARFANWLNNGQGNGDTETGAYTLLGGTPKPTNGLTVTRNTTARVFLPSENEWYKAAYYNPATHSYYACGGSSNTAPTASAPTAVPNSANWNNAVGNLTDVGAYSGTTSPYGAFDMNGNVLQWDEHVTSPVLGRDIVPLERGLRGGQFSNSLPFGSDPGGAHNINGGIPDYVGVDGYQVGFRVAMIVPEPSSVALAALGLVGLAAWGWRRRRA